VRGSNLLARSFCSGIGAALAVVKKTLVPRPVATALNRRPCKRFRRSIASIELLLSRIEKERQGI
jgi:hypothetical protein